ncbi:MAG: pyruvate kinase [bacterium]
MKKTKIIATLGPASADKKTILALARAGVNVFRLNFSHGDLNFFAGIIKNIKEIRTKYKIPLAILQDLQGPKIRIADLKVPVMVKTGEEIFLTEEKIQKTKIKSIQVDIKGMACCVHKGAKILINDGMVQLRVKAADTKLKRVLCVVTAGGLIAGRKGVNLPGVDLPIPSITSKDKKNLIFGLKQGVDIVCLSFVRTRKDMEDLRKFINKKKQAYPLLIAKIEKPEAVRRIKEILPVCDGIMVARGDLAVEAGFKNIPVMQKHLITAANEAKKIVIVATQMLESMISNPFPGRAEITDVYNAVVDNADVLMLSGETSTGKYPVKTVETMSEIISKAEQEIKKQKQGLPAFRETDEKIKNVLSYSCAAAANLIKNSLIMLHAVKLKDIEAVSDYRPYAEIAVFSGAEKIYNSLAFFHGILPVWARDKKEALATVIKKNKKLEGVVYVDFYASKNQAPYMEIIRVNKNTIK